MGQRVDDRERIRTLNDQMRAHGPEVVGPNRWVVTKGIRRLGFADLKRAIETVRSFDKFDDDNDPHGEHDFGSFQLAGERLFWKIDYYDRSLTGGSPDPSDPELTVRILTIMLAMEY